MALRRQVKNVVKNFSDIEVKVREATSNDPWGPSSSLTSEIADATYNVQAFSETMQLLWKRINDHGKNWRHVYKSLVVLDYIIKTGSDRVAQQCRENIFAIKTLKDFQFIDKDGKDQGINVREKSKQLVALLKDEERLKSERQRALKAKERFYQAEGGIGNVSYPKNKKFQGGAKYTEGRGSVDDSNLPSRTWPEIDQSADSRSTDGRIDSEIEKVRPSNEAEEEMQLQIALAMSREEAEIDGSDAGEEKPAPLENLTLQHQPATLLNLTDATPPPLNTNESVFDPWGKPQEPAEPMLGIGLTQAPPVDPWGMPNQAPVNTGFPLQSQAFPPSIIEAPAPIDPWSAPPPAQPADPWGAPVQPLVQAPPQPSIQLLSQPEFQAPPVQPIPQSSVDPWGLSTTVSAPCDPFAPENPSMNLLNEPQGASLFQNTSPSIPIENYESPKQNVSPASSFLANGSHLVNVDNILASSDTNPASSGSNPFKLTAGTGGSSTNPFLQDKPKAKSINEMRSAKTTMFSSGSTQQNFNNDILLPTPVSSAGGNIESSHNPFLS